MQTTHGVRAQFYVQDRNILTFLGQLNNNLRGTARTGTQMGQSFQRSNSYLRALQTTLRYAFAGTVIQRIRMAYQELRAFQNGLADVVAVGTEPSGVPLMAKNLEALGQSALRTSIQTATSAQDILSTQRAIFSSIPNIRALGPGNTVESLTALATRGAAISETDPRTFIQSLQGMRNAFGKEAGTMQQIGDQFFTVIQRSINMTGDEWAHFSGRLVAGASQAGVSLKQMNALMILMTRSGGTAAVNIRHLSQLLSRIRFPVKSAQPFFTEAGIPLHGGAVTNPNITGIDIMRRLLNRAAAVSGFQNPDFSAAGVRGMGGAQFRQQLTAATTGPGLAFLHGAVGGRMEGFRAFLVIARHLNQYDAELGKLTRETRNAGGNQDVINRQFRRFLDQKPLESLAVATNSFTTGLLANMNPLFRILARGTRNFTEWALAIQHSGMNAVRNLDHLLNRTARGTLGHLGINIGAQRAQRLHIGSDAALLGLLATGAMFGGVARRGLGRIGRRVPFIGRLMGGANPLSTALQAEGTIAALQNVATGQRSSPFWVVIHPLSWRMTPPGLFTGNPQSDIENRTARRLFRRVFGGRGEKTPERVVEEEVARRTLLRRIPGLARRIPGLFGRGARGIRGLSGDVAQVGSRIHPADFARFAKFGVGLAAVDFLANPDVLSRGGGTHGGAPSNFDVMFPELATAMGTPGSVGAADLTPSIRRIIRAFQRGRLGAGQANRAIRQLRNLNIDRQILSGTFTNTGLLRGGQTPGAALDTLRGLLRTPGVSAGAFARPGPPGFVDVKIRLEPDKELRGIVKAQDVTVHLPTTLWRDAQPGPTSRGKRKSNRNR